MPARLKALARSPLAPLTLPVAAVAIVALAMATRAFASQTPSPPTPPSSSSVSASSTPTQELVTYTNDQLHFSLKAPADMTYEVEDRGYEQVILFSNADASRMFTVVAAPYTQLDVGTGEEGAPNNTGDQSTELGIVTVYHEDNLSIQFHRNGMIYEIVAATGSQAWLFPILQSWQFTN